MKMIKRLTLRLRITLLTGAILILCAAILTIAASYNARSQFTRLFSTGPLANQPAVIKEGKVTAVEGEPIVTNPGTTGITEAKQNFDLTSVIILIIVSVSGMGLVYVVSGKALRPIHDLSKTISVITEDNLQQRIPEEGVNDEVGTLGNSFNVMLNRLERSFLRQKRFSANVAHELKTPLATISAGIQVLHLENSPTMADYQETLAITERNVKRLQSVVDDLMRLCDEQENIDIVSVNLEEMLEAICSELAPVFKEKGIEAEIHCGLKTVRGNQGLLYRTCFNLIENAAKYNRDGGKILIETKSENGSGKLSVIDTGYGIPPEELQQIFEPFYRVNKSRSRKTGGAGLGLSIVKTIVEKHGWQVSVDSVLGQGSTFTITFAGGGVADTSLQV